MTTSVHDIEDMLEPVVSVMFAMAGLSASSLKLERMPGGGNNRVRKIKTDTGIFLLKEYFHHDLDTRDRLGAEFAFSKFAWERGVRCIPQPLVRQLPCRLGLYEFVEGAPIKPGAVTRGHVMSACEFVLSLNRFRHDPLAVSLPTASDGCFSMMSHLESIDRRVAQLMAIEPISQTDRRTMVFVYERLEPLWRRLRESVLARCAELRLDIHRVVPDHDRIVSPSDFGFHNAIVRPNGGVVFIDFEYAGWDDPAKCVLDFFNQVAVPVPREYVEPMMDKLAHALDSPAQFRQRVHILFPCYRLKWCCMRLMHMLPIHRERRSFAGGANNDGLSRDECLALAESELRDIESSSH